MTAAFERPLERLARAREETLRFVATLDDATMTAQPDPGFSPICWHLGHIAFTEAFWILGRCGEDPSLSAPHARRFAQDGCAKHERAEGYDRSALLDYMASVRSRVVEAWPKLPRESELMANDYVAWLIASHEHQHRETIAIVLGMLDDGAVPDAEALVDEGEPPRIVVEGAEVRLGTDDPLAYDNERPACLAQVETFELDGHPVTAAAWERFMSDGGYDDEALWSREGWQWRSRESITAPRAWKRAGRGWSRPRLGRRVAIDGREPVWGVSWYEADAFARWRGGRLPTEAELELAASRCDGDICIGLRSEQPRRVRRAGLTDVIGNVWEWTADWFEPRPGFAPFPYRGYSTPYFDATHRVMKGGSFATDRTLATASFRNWYQPWIRETYVGLRVAYGPGPKASRQRP